MDERRYPGVSLRWRELWQDFPAVVGSGMDEEEAILVHKAIAILRRRIASGRFHRFDPEELRRCELAEAVWLELNVRLPVVD